MENSPLDAAIARYRETLNALEQARTSHPSPQQVLEVLLARDAVEALKADQPGSARLFLELPNLDQRLEHHRASIIYATRREKWRRQIQIQTDKWWWKLVYSPSPLIYVKSLWVQRRQIAFRQSRCRYFFCSVLELSWVTIVWICDRLDPLWKLATVGLIICSLSLAANIAPRFFAGAPSAEGAFAIIAPSIISLILGKEMLEQLTKGQGAIEHFLASLGVPRLLRHEVAFLLALLVFGSVSWINQHRGEFAQCYYNRGEKAVNLAFNNVNQATSAQNQPTASLCQPIFWLSPSQINQALSAKMLSSAEIDFNRAVALNPDYAEAYFLLGKIYELSQDLDKAKIQYRLAIQNGSLKARSRLAWLYLIDEKDEKAETKKRLVDNADVILRQGKTDIDQLGTDQSTDILDTQLDWHLAVALVRSRQKRKDEALNHLSDARGINKEAEKNHNYQGKVFYCIQAEILQIHEKNKKQDIDKSWHLCSRDNSFDLVHYFWRTKATEYFLKNPKSL